METKEFYRKFIDGFNRAKEENFEANKNFEIKNREWTEGISSYIKTIFETNTDLKCICKDKKLEKGSMQEFLAIDFTVFNTNDRATLDNLSDQVVIYAIEHENNPCCDRIAHNISKLLNVKAENKVLIGYVEKSIAEDKKADIFNKIHVQLKNISENYFREKEKLLVILGVYGMEDSSGYSANLYYLKSKRRKKL